MVRDDVNLSMACATLFQSGKEWGFIFRKAEVSNESGGTEAGDLFWAC
jgi:hypothetical protein